MDINIALEDFKSRMYIRESYGEQHFIMPFFLMGSDDSLPLKFYEENGVLYISDSGATFDHLTNMYVDVYKYSEKIEKVKERFGLREGDYHAFVMAFPSDQVISVEMFVGYYIQALSVIANIDID